MNEIHTMKSYKKEVSKLIKEEYPYIICHYEAGERAHSAMLMVEDGHGFVRLTWYPNEHWAYISDLSLDEEYRGKGFGDALMDLVEDIAIVCEFTYLRLEVRKNSWMHRWYERLGYRYFSKCEDERYVLLQQKLNNK